MGLVSLHAPDQITAIKLIALDQRTALFDLKGVFVVTLAGRANGGARCSTGHAPWQCEQSLHKTFEGS
jgi:hypothetical protein